MNTSIGTAFLVSEKILESGVAQLTGATDISGNYLVTFPVSTVPLLDESNIEDLASLLRFYFSLLKCADQVKGMSVLANLQHASSTGISIWLKSLEMLQKEIPGVFATIYVIKPKSMEKSRHLKKQLGLKSKKPALGDSLFKVAWLKNIQEVYNHIDPSQLTEDYGGFLSYNHQAWFHFQMDIGNLVRKAHLLEAKIPSAKDQILLLQEYEIVDLNLKELDQLLEQLEGKYHEIMKNLNLEATIDKCQYAIGSLEKPETDPVLAQLSSVLLFSTKSDLCQLYNYFVTTKKELAQIWQEVNYDIQQFRQFHMCKEKANQLCREISEQYELRIEQHPIVGKTLNESQMCNLHFESSLYVPAKKLLTRATEILEELQHIQLPKIPQEDSDPGFLVEFTNTIQIFAETLDDIYKQYANIHLFYLVFEKCLVWYQKVLHFLPISLNELLISLQDPPSTASSSSSTSSSSSVDRHQSKAERIPEEWPRLVATVHSRYPGPKKEHLSILNYAAPSCIDCDARGHSALLSQRIQLLTAVFQKNLFRRHQLQKALEWKDLLLAGEDNIVNYYLQLNNSVFPQVQERPSELQLYSRTREETSMDGLENGSQENLLSIPFQRENSESPMFVLSQEDFFGKGLKASLTNIEKRSNKDKKEYFVSLSCDSDMQSSTLRQDEELDMSSSHAESGASTQLPNVKYTKSAGMKCRKDRKQGRNQPLKKTKRASSLQSFPHVCPPPSTYKDSKDRDYDSKRDFSNSSANWSAKDVDSHRTIIKEIKKVTSSNLPNDEKVDLVQNLLSILHLHSPTDTPTDSASCLMPLQETQYYRPRFNSFTYRSVSGPASRPTGFPGKAHHSHTHHHHHHHPRTSRTKSRKPSLLDSKPRQSSWSKWEEKKQFLSSDPMFCSCIQLNCAHDNNLVRVQDDNLSHSMHNLGREEVIYDKLSDTVSLSKEHDSYPNLNQAVNLVPDSGCNKDYNKPPSIPVDIVHPLYTNTCSGHPPSPMAVSPGRGMNYVNEWMNCSEAADGLAEDLNTVSLYSSPWDTSESQHLEEVEEISQDESFDCQFYEQQQEEVRSSLQRTEEILLEQERLMYSHLVPEEDPTLMADELLSHWSSDSAYVGDSEQLCPSGLSSNMTQRSSTSSDCGFVGRESYSPDLPTMGNQDEELLSVTNLVSNLRGDMKWLTEDDDEREAGSILDRDYDSESDDSNKTYCEDFSVRPKDKRGPAESSLNRGSRADPRIKAEKHHSITTPVKLSIFQTSTTSEVDVEEFY